MAINVPNLIEDIPFKDEHLKKARQAEIEEGVKSIAAELK